MEEFLVKPLINSVVYSFLGFAILLICYFILEKLTPEKTWKEIVENKNIALAIVFGCFILGISLIIGLAIHG
jgi:putative membrane protein